MPNCYNSYMVNNNNIKLATAEIGAAAPAAGGFGGFGAFTATSSGLEAHFSHSEPWIQSEDDDPNPIFI